MALLNLSLTYIAAACLGCFVAANPPAPKACQEPKAKGFRFADLNQDQEFEWGAWRDECNPKKVLFSLPE